MTTDAHYPEGWTPAQIESWERYENVPWTGRWMTATPAHTPGAIEGAVELPAPVAGRETSGDPGNVWFYYTCDASDPTEYVQEDLFRLADLLHYADARATQAAREARADARARVVAWLRRNADPVHMRWDHLVTCDIADAVERGEHE